MITVPAIIMSVLSPAIAVAIYLLNKYWAGRIRMTDPQEIRFGHHNNGRQSIRVGILTLVYVKLHNGRYISNIYVRLQREETIQTFPICYIGEHEWVRAGPAYIGDQDKQQYYHFLLPDEGSNYSFKEGKYLLEVFVQIKNKSTRRIFKQHFSLSPEIARQMNRKKGDIVFRWLPGSKEYVSNIDSSQVKFYQQRKDTNEKYGK
ncbi:MAG TPA: hypothetical protein VNS58_09210 [Puia sp.]|nr:hypothetical protein [Puia sp.]